MRPYFAGFGDSCERLLLVSSMMKNRGHAAAKTLVKGPRMQQYMPYCTVGVWYRNFDVPRTPSPKSAILDPRYYDLSFDKNARHDTLSFNYIQYSMVR